MKTQSQEHKIVISKYKQTFIASTKLSRRIDLEKASDTLPSTMYEPEHFPALIYLMKDPKVEILLFESGKVVCTSAKKGDIYGAIEELDDWGTHISPASTKKSKG
jgi:TATA-box binding protein (TBP) (component of TFIID and TFIIIB)